MRVEHANKEPYLLIHYVSIHQDNFVSRSAFLETIEIESLSHLKIELHSVLGLENGVLDPKESIRIQKKPKSINTEQCSHCIIVFLSK